MPGRRKIGENSGGTGDSGGRSHRENETCIWGLRCAPPNTRPRRNRAAHPTSASSVPTLPVPRQSRIQKPRPAVPAQRQRRRWESPGRVSRARPKLPEGKSQPALPSHAPSSPLRPSPSSENGPRWGAGLPHPAVRREGNMCLDDEVRGGRRAESDKEGRVHSKKGWENTRDRVREVHQRTAVRLRMSWIRGWSLSRSKVDATKREV